jgi:hypothetical protein
MNVFIIGMRRSGTTILFDCLYEDKRFDFFYEPFCHGKINIGGGSGARYVGFGNKLNTVRQEFISKRNLNVSSTFFNLGSPRDFKQEFEEEIPSLYRDYLKFLCSKNKITLMKFVRASYKLKTLHEIFPDAKIIHIFKDPRRMAMSHIFGRARKNIKGIRKVKQYIKKIWKRKTFFSRQNGFDNWSSERLIDYFIESNPYYNSFKRSPAYEKIMLLWKILNDRTRADGKIHFQSNYLEVRHEDLCSNPGGTLDFIYNFLNLSCPTEVKNWANSHIKAPKPIYRKNDKRWADSARKLEIDFNT